MKLRTKVIAAIDPQELEQKVNEWLESQEPMLPFWPLALGDGSEFNYTVMLFYEIDQDCTTGKARE